MNVLNKKFKLYFIFFVLLFSISIIPSADADRIIPSNRVSSHLNVRQGPNINSLIVEILYPNESAELLVSIPYWYKVRLNSGITGFVSKAWTDKVSNAEDKGELIRLGSWKIKKLGHDTSKDFQLLTQVIDSNFDVLVVVEVMQKQGGHPGYDNLLSELGSSWAGLITDSPRPNTSSGNAEYYAILYRTAIVRPCSGWDHLIYHEDNDGSGNDSGPDYFSREPAFSCFEAPLNNTSIGFDFLLAAYHARWADGDTDKISEEVRHIVDVFATMESARQGERDIFIAGDFNLVPDLLRAIIPMRIRTQGSGSTLNSIGDITANLYDHLLVFDEQATSEMIGNPEVLEIRNVPTSNQLFYQTISDHLPIVVRLRTSGTDDD